MAARPHPPQLNIKTKENKMLLEHKTAIVYGGAGAIGSSVGRAFAREGADVHLVGRTESALAHVALSIRSAGGSVEIAQADALDQAAVDAHAAAVAAANGIDVAFNATSNEDVQGTPLADMSFADFLRPVTKAVTAQYVIATAVARHMVPRGSGVILAMAGGREAIPNLGGSHVAWAALAGLCRQLASELGPHGIRVAWLLSPGSPDTDAAGDPFADDTLLRRRPSYEDVANVAAFLASDWARTMTATEVNITGGSVID
jgi:3-oxoacyl-[acyl-carrier protein] reductase